MNFKVLSCVILAGCVAGCGVSPIYEDGPRAGAAVISKRSAWKTSGDLGQVANATDGNVNTVAMGMVGSTRGRLIVDLGKPCLFNMVVVDHGPNRDGFCRRLAIATSLNGRDYTPRHAVAGTRRVTIANLPQAVLARYVAIELVGAGQQPFSVGEVYFQ